MADEKLTKAGAVELEEDKLDQASGGVNKIDSLTIKQKTNIVSRSTQPPDPS